MRIVVVVLAVVLVAALAAVAWRRRRRCGPRGEWLERIAETMGLRRRRKETDEQLRARLGAAMSRCTFTRADLVETAKGVAQEHGCDANVELDARTGCVRVRVVIDGPASWRLAAAREAIARELAERLPLHVVVEVTVGDAS